MWTISFVMPDRPLILPKVSTRLPLGWNVVKFEIGDFKKKKICRGISSFVKVGEMCVALYINKYLWHRILTNEHILYGYYGFVN